MMLTISHLGSPIRNEQRKMGNSRFPDWPERLT